MDDTTAFEHQVENVLQHAAGPSLPVDAVSIVELATTGHWTVITRRLRRGATTPTEGRLTMLSAVKFVAAAAIVALFGGFLLSGVLTTPQGDDMAPAAVTESPSPMTTEELLSGMVTEEVEPGVFRVVHDGFRDLTVPVRGYPGAMVDVTPDGGVWLSDDEGRLGLFRLGEERVFEDHRGWPPFKEVAPDGSLWVSDWLSDDRLGIFSFDGGRWTVRATTTDDGLLLGALAVGADSTVWLAASDRDKHCPDTDSADCIGTVLLRVEDDGTTASVDDWTDVYEGDVAHDELAVGPDGDVWLIGMERWDGPEAESLLRFDGDEWQLIPGPDGFINNAMGQSIALGPDGTLWVHTRDPERSDWNGAGLARFDDPGWTTFTETDGVEDWGGQGFIATDLFDIVPDGSLWMNGIGHSGCDGVDHYDGTTWTSYLRDSCVHDLAIAPDGSVWVRADIEDVPWNATSWDVGLYVITPEARG